MAHIYSRAKIQIGQISFAFVLPPSSDSKESANLENETGSKEAPDGSFLTDDRNQDIGMIDALKSDEKIKNELESKENQADAQSNDKFDPKKKDIKKKPMDKKDGIKKNNSKSRSQPQREYLPEEIPEEYREKPQFSYSHLITTALRAHPEAQGISLSKIYKSIQDIFPYYQYCPHGWKNSVRHNLSSNKVFKKISKEGKGWLWGIDEDYFQERERARQKAAQNNRNKEKAAAAAAAQAQALAEARAKAKEEKEKELELQKEKINALQKDNISVEKNNILGHQQLPMQHSNKASLQQFQNLQHSQNTIPQSHDIHQSQTLSHHYSQNNQGLVSGALIDPVQTQKLVLEKLAQQQMQKVTGMNSNQKSNFQNSNSVNTHDVKNSPLNQQNLQSSNKPFGSPVSSFSQNQGQNQAPINQQHQASVSPNQAHSSQIQHQQPQKSFQNQSLPASQSKTGLSQNSKPRTPGSKLSVPPNGGAAKFVNTKNTVMTSKQPVKPGASTKMGVSSQGNSTLQFHNLPQDSSSTLLSTAPVTSSAPPLKIPSSISSTSTDPSLLASIQKTGLSNHASLHPPPVIQQALGSKLANILGTYDGNSNILAGMLPESLMNKINESNLLSSTNLQQNITPAHGSSSTAPSALANTTAQSDGNQGNLNTNTGSAGNFQSIASPLTGSNAITEDFASSTSFSATAPMFQNSASAIAAAAAAAADKKKTIAELAREITIDRVSRPDYSNMTRDPTAGSPPITGTGSSEETPINMLPLASGSTPIAGSGSPLNATVNSTPAKSSDTPKVAKPQTQNDTFRLQGAQNASTLAKGSKPTTQPLSTATKATNTNLNIPTSIVNVPFIPNTTAPLPVSNTAIPSSIKGKGVSGLTTPLFFGNMMGPLGSLPAMPDLPATTSTSYYTTPPPNVSTNPAPVTAKSVTGKGTKGRSNPRKAGTKRNAKSNASSSGGVKNLNTHTQNSSYKVQKQPLGTQQNKQIPKTTNVASSISQQFSNNKQPKAQQHTIPQQKQMQGSSQQFQQQSSYQQNQQQFQQLTQQYPQSQSVYQQQQSAQKQAGSSQIKTGFQTGTQQRPSQQGMQNKQTRIPKSLTDNLHNVNKLNNVARQASNINTNVNTKPLTNVSSGNVIDKNATGPSHLPHTATTGNNPAVTKFHQPQQQYLPAKRQTLFTANATTAKNTTPVNRGKSSSPTVTSVQNMNAGSVTPKNLAQTNTKASVLNSGATSASSSSRPSTVPLSKDTLRVLTALSEKIKKQIQGTGRSITQDMLTNALAIAITQLAKNGGNKAIANLINGNNSEQLFNAISSVVLEKTKKGITPTAGQKTTASIAGSSSSAAITNALRPNASKSASPVPTNTIHNTAAAGTTYTPDTLGTKATNSLVNSNMSTTGGLKNPASAVNTKPQAANVSRNNVQAQQSISTSRGVPALHGISHPTSGVSTVSGIPASVTGVPYSSGIPSSRTAGLKVPQSISNPNFGNLNSSLPASMRLHSAAVSLGVPPPPGILSDKNVGSNLSATTTGSSYPTASGSKSNATTPVIPSKTINSAKVTTKRGNVTKGKIQGKGKFEKPQRASNTQPKTPLKTNNAVFPPKQVDTNIQPVKVPVQQPQNKISQSTSAVGSKDSTKAHEAPAITQNTVPQATELQSTVSPTVANKTALPPNLATAPSSAVSSNTASANLSSAPRTSSVGSALPATSSVGSSSSVSRPTTSPKPVGTVTPISEAALSAQASNRVNSTSNVGSTPKPMPSKPSTPSSVDKSVTSLPASSSPVPPPVSIPKPETVVPATPTAQSKSPSPGAATTAAVAAAMDVNVTGNSFGLKPTKDLSSQAQQIAQMLAKASRLKNPSPAIQASLKQLQAYAAKLGLTPDGKPIPKSGTEPSSPATAGVKRPAPQTAGSSTTASNLGEPQPKIMKK